jgi:hypothetical protein
LNVIKWTPDGPDDAAQGVCHVGEVGDAAADDEDFAVRVRMPAHQVEDGLGVLVGLRDREGIKWDAEDRGFESSPGCKVVFDAIKCRRLRLFLNSLLLRTCKKVEIGRSASVAQWSLLEEKIMGANGLMCLLCKFLALQWSGLLLTSNSRKQENVLGILGFRLLNES